VELVLVVQREVALVRMLVAIASDGSAALVVAAVVVHILVAAVVVHTLVAGTAPVVVVAAAVAAAVVAHILVAGAVLVVVVVAAAVVVHILVAGAVPVDGECNIAGSADTDVLVQVFRGVVMAHIELLLVELLDGPRWVLDADNTQELEAETSSSLVVVEPEQRNRSDGRLAVVAKPFEVPEEVPEEEVVG
jgi:hypothetical protein